MLRLLVLLAKLAGLLFLEIYSPWQITAFCIRLLMLGKLINLIKIRMEAWGDKRPRGEAVV